MRRNIGYLFMAVVMICATMLTSGCDGGESTESEPVNTSEVTSEPEPTTADATTSQPEATNAEIGDNIVSDSIQARVWQVESTSSLTDDNITIYPDEGFVILVVTVEMENLGETAAETTLPKSTSVRCAEQQYELTCVGTLYRDNLRLLYGSGGQMSVGPVDESYKVTGDFTNDMWTVEIAEHSIVNIVLVYLVPADSSGVVLYLPDFLPVDLGI